jgi:hypothetical protein
MIKASLRRFTIVNGFALCFGFGNGRSSARAEPARR